MFQMGGEVTNVIGRRPLPPAPPTERGRRSPAESTTRSEIFLLLRLQFETELAIRGPTKVKRPRSNLGTLVFPDRGHHEAENDAISAVNMMARDTGGFETKLNRSAFKELHCSTLPSELRVLGDQLYDSDGALHHHVWRPRRDSNPQPPDSKN